MNASWVPAGLSFMYHNDKRTDCIILPCYQLRVKNMYTSPSLTSQMKPKRERHGWSFNKLEGLQKCTQSSVFGPFLGSLGAQLENVRGLPSLQRKSPSLTSSERPIQILLAGSNSVDLEQLPIFIQVPSGAKVLLSHNMQTHHNTSPKTSDRPIAPHI